MRRNFSACPNVTSGAMPRHPLGPDKPFREAGISILACLLMTISAGQSESSTKNQKSDASAIAFPQGRVIIHALLPQPSRTYILAGEFSPAGSAQQDDSAAAIKTSKREDIVWQKYFDAPARGYVGAATETTNGNILLYGRSEQMDGSYKGWLRLLDRDGNVLKTTSLNSGKDMYNNAQLSTLEDGTILVAFNSEPGAKTKSIELVKLDSGGNQLWRRKLPRTKDLYMYTAASSGNHLYVLAQEFNVLENHKTLWLTKVDQAGQVMFQKPVTDTGEEITPWKMIISPTGKISVSGERKTSSLKDPKANKSEPSSTAATNANTYTPPPTDIWVKQLTLDGAALWTFTRDIQERDSAYDVAHLEDGKILLSGGTREQIEKDSDVYMAVIDKDGKVYQEFFLGEVGVEEDLSLVATGHDGQLILVGSRGAMGRGSISKPWIVDINDVTEIEAKTLKASKVNMLQTCRVSGNAEACRRAKIYFPNETLEPATKATQPTNTELKFDDLDSLE